MADPELCRAIGAVLATCDGKRCATRAIATFIKEAGCLRTPASVADIHATLLHLEESGDVQRHADRDDKTLLSWTITEAGKIRFPL